MEIRMVPEVENWLAGIRDQDPGAAEGIDEAVAALRAGGTSVGPPLVVPVEAPPRPGATTPVPPQRGQGIRPHSGRRGGPASGAGRWLLARTAFPGLDAAYGRQLEQLTLVRRAVAGVATSRKRLELQIERLEREVRDLDGQERAEAGDRGFPETRAGRAAEAAEGQLADLRREYSAAQAEEERVTVASQRLQAALDEFRAHKEAAKAAYLAAEEATEATSAEVAGGEEQSAHSAGETADAGPGDPKPRFWLSELRPGPPASAGARILFTVEPSGTAVLLAAGTESDRLHAWYADAIARATIRYQRGRQGSASRSAPSDQAGSA
jgi:hypothetical protein